MSEPKLLSNDQYFFINKETIPQIKKILPILFGKETPPTKSIEIFSRICGYKSWAALKNQLTLKNEALTKQYDVKTDKIYLSLTKHTKYHLQVCQQYGVLNLLVKGLEKSFTYENGWNKTKNHISLQDIIEDVDNISENSPFTREPKESIFGIISPKNIKDLLLSEINLGTDDRNLDPHTWILFKTNPGSSHQILLYGNPDTKNTVKGNLYDIMQFVKDNQKDHKIMLFSHQDKQDWTNNKLSKSIKNPIISQEIGEQNQHNDIEYWILNLTLSKNKTDKNSQSEFIETNIIKKMNEIYDTTHTIRSYQLPLKTQVESELELSVLERTA